MQNLTSTSKQFLFHDDLVTINRDILDFQDLFEESKSGPVAFLPAQHLRHLIKFGMQPILEEILLVNKVGSNIALKCVKKKTAKLLALNRNVVQV